MASASWAIAATRARKRAAANLGLLVDAQLTRLSTQRSTITGNLLPGVTEPVEALIDGADIQKIGGRETLRTARHTVTLYDIMVEPGETIEWDGRRHEILEVRGIVADGATRYESVAITN